MNTLEKKYELKQQGNVIRSIAYFVLVVTMVCFLKTPLEESSFMKEFMFIALITVSITLALYGELLRFFKSNRKTFRTLFIIYIVIAIVGFAIY